MVWIFGYGSLIWRPGFPYARAKICYAKNYKRVWHQGSTDHRGTVDRPGRTVTLEGRAGAVVWGRAFDIGDDGDDATKEILATLRIREKQYDLEKTLDLYEASGEVAVRDALTWIATPNRETNPNYLGPASLDDLSAQIARSRGPSGPNSEYVFMLAKAMREYGLEDDDLFRIEAKVKGLLGEAA